MPAPPTRLEVLRPDLATLHTEMLKKLDHLGDEVRDDNLYAATGAGAELDDLVDRWADLGDEINYREGYDAATSA